MKSGSLDGQGRKFFDRGKEGKKKVYTVMNFKYCTQTERESTTVTVNDFDVN